MAENAFRLQECRLHLPEDGGPDPQWPALLFVYLDDILIASTTREAHLEHVNSILDLLSLHGLSINPEKCVFMAPKMLSPFLAAKTLLCTVSCWYTRTRRPQSLSQWINQVLLWEQSFSRMLLVFWCWAPLAFYSRKLSAAETRYSSFDRESLAAWSTLRHFWSLLKGNEYVLYTDHKPLSQALFRTSPPWSAMQQRRLSYISEFNCHIKHLHGVSENKGTDVLSHLVIALQDLLLHCHHFPQHCRLLWLVYLSLPLSLPFQQKDCLERNCSLVSPLLCSCVCPCL